MHEGPANLKRECIRQAGIVNGFPGFPVVDKFALSFRSQSKNGPEFSLGAVLKYWKLFMIGRE